MSESKRTKLFRKTQLWGPKYTPCDGTSRCVCVYFILFYVYTKNPEEENLWEQIMTQLPMSQTVSLLRRLGSLVRLNVGENNNVSKQIQSVTMVEYQ